MYGVVAILSVCFALVQGATLTVGTSQDYQTIAAAVAASSSGDVILLNNETFSGDGNYNVDLSNRNITIQASITGSTIISCQYQGRAFTGAFTFPSTVTFNGISFQNCSAADGGAIHFHDSNNDTVNSFVVEFVDCSFSANQATSNGGAVAIGNNNNGVSGVSISGSTFSSNQGNAGGALYVSSVNLIIQNTTFHHNTAVVSGGAITVRTGTVSLIDSEIHHNTVSPGYGGAVYLGPGSTSSSDYSSFHHNTASSNYGGAWFVDHFAVASFTDNELYANSADHAGAVCVKFNANLTVTSSSLTNNTANVYGGAVHAYQANSVVFEQSTLNGNKAYGGAFAYIVLVKSVVFSNSSVYDNEASDYGSTMYCQDTDVDFQSSPSTLDADSFQCGPDCEADGEGIQYCPPVPDCSAEKKRQHDVEIVLIVFALLVGLGITYFVYYFVGQIQQAVPTSPTQHAPYAQL